MVSAAVLVAGEMATLAAGAVASAAAGSCAFLFETVPPDGTVLGSLAPFGVESPSVLLDCVEVSGFLFFFDF